MTLAIVTRDAASDMLGAAATSADRIALSCVVAASPGAGIVLAQGAPDPDLASRTLVHLRAGEAPEAACTRALADDAARSRRQLLVVDTRGRTAAFSGRECQPLFGHTRGTDHAAGGELLASPDAVGAASLSFERSGGDPLWERLLLALESGIRGGADQRGARSALLIVFGTDEHPLVELRVEDHSQPAAELRRRLVLWNERRVPGAGSVGD